MGRVRSTLRFVLELGISALRVPMSFRIFDRMALGVCESVQLYEERLPLRLRERQRLDQGTQAGAFGALGCGGEEDFGRNGPRRSV